MKSFRLSSKSLFIATLLLCVGLFVAHPALAQVDLKSFAENAGFSTGPSLTVIIARLIRTAISFVGVVAVIFVLYGGFMFMTAGGNTDRIKKAKGILINALIGLVLVFASFAIVSFVLGALMKATGANTTSQNNNKNSNVDLTQSKPVFYLSKVNTECASALRNLKLQFNFSKTIKLNEKNEVVGIFIHKKGDQNAVPGTFSVIGKRVEFVPSAPCPDTENATLHCFDANADYAIDLNANSLTSSVGAKLSCTAQYPCSFSFTTGSGVDTKEPTLKWNAPVAGSSVKVGENELLQVQSKDDTGVAVVDFYAVDGATPIFSAGLNFSSTGVLTGNNIENYFFTNVSEEWNTIGYVTNKSYQVWAEGKDCAGNPAMTDKVSLMVRAANCGNDVQDKDLGETDVDCGGDPKSEYYCGACNGSACKDNAECSSGSCVNGVCKTIATITSVSPGDGAKGNLITISGKGFGSTPGAITFLGKNGQADVKASAYQCDGKTSWSTKEVVVQVPDAAEDGPIRLTTSDVKEFDTTNDQNGPVIANFDVNLIKRPGLCSVIPNTEFVNQSTTLKGLGFKEVQNTSTVYFFDAEAGSYSGWKNDTITVGVPNVNQGSYTVQVFTGDAYCINAKKEVLSSKKCATNDQCDVKAGEFCGNAVCSETLGYCQTKEQCGTQGKCESIRVGSNPKTFFAKTSSAETKAVVSYVDSGWKTCQGGTQGGKKCKKNDDCVGGGSCKEAKDVGPSGQYVTIYGSGFGSAKGSVKFIDPASGNFALGNVEFPQGCETYWTDTSITVKVPFKYENAEQTPVSFGAHNLVVAPNIVGVAPTDPIKFTIVNDKPGPSVCAIEPKAGPVGTDVVVTGENFGSTKGSVVFTDNKPSLLSYWQSSVPQQIGLKVPESSKTGPVFVLDADQNTSNSVNFAVGNCKENAKLCPVNTLCCADGTCSNSCEPKEKKATFAYSFSTNTLPVVPVVLTQCDKDVISPSPALIWSQPQAICVNAAVQASFGPAKMEMDPTSFTDQNIVVQMCALDKEKEGICEQWEAPLKSSKITASATGFSWSPEKTFEPNRLFQVTLKAKGTGSVGIRASKAKGGAYLAKDYVWTFRTSKSTDLCEVGGVNVDPATFTQTKQNENTAYNAQLISKEDKCVVLSCKGYSLGWSSSSLSASVENPNPANGECGNQVKALEETPPGDPAKIVAMVLNATNKPSDTGLLTIDFTDPIITAFFPSCSDSCVNVLPWMKFNTNMVVDTINTQNIKLFECKNSLCASNELIDVTSEFLSGAVDYLAAEKTASLKFYKDSVKLKAKQWYRVVVNGGLMSTSNVSLSKSGSNFGTDQNKYFTQAFSWKFRTKESDISCGVDRVSVLPKETILSYVGERQEFGAMAFGAPDQCSVNGQSLQGDKYVWKPWSAMDTPPGKFGEASFPSGKIPETSSPSQVVAYLIKGGNIELAKASLPLYCSSACTNIGAPVTTADSVCGNGKLEKGEDCDDGNTIKEDGCSSTCRTSGTVVCTEKNKTECCGNGKLEPKEQCDDGNATSGDGCSSVCSNEGSSSVGSTCGDGVVDHSVITGGESCDDGNKTDGDGCSSMCINEGSVSKAKVYAVCGNGNKDIGEDCDDGNIASGDGCSSSCLFEGKSFCASGNKVNCCGNGVVDSGEDPACDLKGGITEGCTTRCVKAGSSPYYSAPSFCGDGEPGLGEVCEIAPEAKKKVGPYSVAQVAPGAQVEVDEKTGYAVSSVTATADSKSGVGLVKLQCTCGSDTSCGTNTANIGCGASNCCYERPKILATNPGLNETNVCRNSAVWVEFNQIMDANSFGSVDKNGDGKISADEFDPNLRLELTKIGGVAVTDLTCPKNYEKVVYESKTGGNIFAKTWNWIKNSFLGLFGKSAQAIAGFHCFVPVTYQENVSGVADRVYLNTGVLLEANAQYTLTVKSDNNLNDEKQDGVVSKNHVSLCLGANCSDVASSKTFTVGNEICTLDKVNVVDQGKNPVLPTESVSANFYTKKGETHNFLAQALTIRKDTGLEQEIASVANVYFWEWGWSSSISDTETKTNIAHNTVVSPEPKSLSAAFYAEGNNGDEEVLVTAKVTDATIKEKTTTTDMVGATTVTAFICENPWPSTPPFVETTKKTNYSFFYCRDAGGPGTADDLPGLGETPEYPISNTDIISEKVFTISGTKDSIGVRVMKNPTYLSPSAWYQSKGFTDKTTATDLDGYSAIQAGTTIYAASANQDGSLIYPNMYILSYNPDAGKEAKQIFDAILNNFQLNGNTEVISDLRICKAGAIYEKDKNGQYVSCAWDGDCAEVCVPDKLIGKDGTCSLSGNACKEDKDCVYSPINPGSAIFCDADKAKLIRDTKRLTDVSDLVSKIETSGAQSKHCSVAKNKSCYQDSDCSGTEKCVSGYPTIQSGTLIPGISNSLWPSWNSVLGNALRVALPTDPINKFWMDCKDKQKDGFDPATCWNGVKNQFACLDRSYLYGYKASGSEDYTLYSQLEYTGGTWANDIDQSANDHATVRFEYPKQTENNIPANLKNGFYSGPLGEFCGGLNWGAKGVCGDGVKGVGEVCEKGETQTLACTDKNNKPGSVSVSCKPDCSGFMSVPEAQQAGAACIPVLCGNGTKETGETCDDGALNGTYGHCNKTCNGTSFVCGDGYLAAGEQCDCGSPQNFSGLAAKSWAKTNGCIGPNGSYSASGKSCTYDCKLPGPSCGDSIVQAPDEQCDFGVNGGEEAYAGAVCSDNITKCKQNSDCPQGSTCSQLACGKGRVCAKGNPNVINQVCTMDIDCGVGGVCPTAVYDLVMVRQCGAQSCKWGGFSSCRGAGQYCGNGKVEGTEECDDGNQSNFDACTNTCKKNICGDGYVNVGVEACDSGLDNGKSCIAPYGGSCNACNKFCQYKAMSGEFCGDGKINGAEYCDGKAKPYSCMKADQEKSTVQGTCAPEDEGKTGAAGKCPDGYTCRNVGFCNGGSLFGENGAACTLYGAGYPTGNENLNNCDGYCSQSKKTCNHIQPFPGECDSGETCIGFGTCVEPVCGSDCLSSCPTSFKQEVVQIQSSVQGSQPSNAIDLYSYKNIDGNFPDSASLLIPACQIGTKITADIEQNTKNATVSVVFIVDLTKSMGTEKLGNISRLQTVKNALSKSISDLFLQYGPNVKIGVVGMGKDAIEIKSLSGQGDQFALELAVNTLLIANQDWTNPAKAYQKASDWLAIDSAKSKYAIFIADEPSTFPDFDLSNTSCAVNNTDKCISEILTSIIAVHKDINYFTLAILNKPYDSKAINPFVGYMAHISSETCTNKNLYSESECSYGQYAQNASDDTGFQNAYKKIIGFSSGSVVTLDLPNTDKTTVPTSASFNPGANVLLPSIPSFTCTGVPFKIPIRATFGGVGTVTFKNVNFNYCPL